MVRMSESSASPVSPSLRDRIANVIHDALCGCEEAPNWCDQLIRQPARLAAADAVVALLGLTEERTTCDHLFVFGEDKRCSACGVLWQGRWPIVPVTRLVGPWRQVNP